MRFDEYVNEIAKGAKTAFGLSDSLDTIADCIIDFDSLYDGCWSFSLTGRRESGIRDIPGLKLYGCPIELIVTCEGGLIEGETEDDDELEMPVDLSIQIMGGTTTDSDRVNELLGKIEDHFGRQIVFNDVDSEQPLLFDFGMEEIESPERISKRIVELVKALTDDDNAGLTRELMSLCDNESYE